MEITGNVVGDNDKRYNLTIKGNIKAGSIKVGNINVWDIDAANIDAININAWMINTGNISAVDLNARDINAKDIDAGDINARYINAWNVDAYFIICESLKQKRGSKLVAKMLIDKRNERLQKLITRKGDYSDEQGRCDK